MKTIPLESEELTLQQLLEEAAKGEVVFLTRGGETQFALVSADEGDQEVFAIRSNAELLKYLSECEERARTRPRKTLTEIREQQSRWEEENP